MWIDDVRAALATLDSEAKACDSAEEAQRVIEMLDDVMRNDFRLVRQTWDARRHALLDGKRVAMSDGRTIYERPKKKYTWHHDRIGALCASRAQFDDAGERIDDIELVASKAVVLAMSCYVTPSTEPRWEGLQQLGFEKKEAAALHVETVGAELKVVVPK